MSATGSTRLTHRIGASIFLLLLLTACKDQQPVAPPAKGVPNLLKPPLQSGAMRTLDLTRKPDLYATVTTVSTHRDKAGKTRQTKFSQKVKATFKDGLARVVPDGASGDFAAGAMFASVSNAATSLVDSTQDESILTPVLAVESGILAYNYANSYTDSVGNVFESYFWAPTEGIPVTDAWAYRNGILIAEYHANWEQASGGHVLTDQSLGSYEDGALVGTLVSTIEWGSDECPTCVTEPAKNEFFGPKVGSYFRLALDKVGCWLSPQVAYASTPCIWEAAEFAVATYGMYLATTSGVAFLQPGWYFVGWGAWTRNVFSLARCVDKNLEKLQRGGGKCKTNPHLCQEKT